MQALPRCCSGPTAAAGRCRDDGTRLGDTWSEAAPIAQTSSFQGVRYSRLYMMAAASGSSTTRSFSTSQ